MPDRPTRLTAESIEGILGWILEGGIDSLDLRSVRFVDPYALLLLDLVILEARERGVPVRIDWPETPAVRGWMNAMGFFDEIGEVATRSIRDVRSVLQPITTIADEAGISRIVNGFHHRLAERYPVTESGRRRLTAIMIELFQNIPHHSNATGAVTDPHGVAAMQDYENAIFLAIADKGIGLRGSLGLRDGYEQLTDSQALKSILQDGLSRFDDVGRGGELKRIVGIVRSYDGMFALRSGTALLYFDELGGDVYDVTDFPGVQLAIRIPLRLFDPELVDP